jgi:hypothetical protein
MKDQGFGTLPADKLAYYIERDWTFLAVKIQGKHRADTMDASGRLPALSITFASKQAVYPLKLSTHMNEFSSKITLFTLVKPKKEDFRAAVDRGFEVLHADGYLSERADGSAPLVANNTEFSQRDVPRALKRAMRARFGMKPKTLYMSVLLNERVNAKKGEGPRYTSRPHEWPEDLSVPGVPDGQQLRWRR